MAAPGKAQIPFEGPEWGALLPLTQGQRTNSIHITHGRPGCPIVVHQWSSGAPRAEGVRSTRQCRRNAPAVQREQL